MAARCSTTPPSGSANRREQLLTLAFTLLAQGPLRREAGERKGPIAKQWGGQVVSNEGKWFQRVNAAHLALPALRAGPLPLPPLKRAERAFELRK